VKAAKLNLPVIEKGATWRHSLIWNDSNGQPINLTDCTAKMQVRETVESASFLLELSTENNRITITPSIGKMDFYIAAADTDALIGAGGLYDLEIYFLNSDTVRLCYGVVMFSEQITR
jgi:hypothetical protein